MTYDRRDWDERQVQILRQEIADRLRSVCEHVTDDDFSQLVEQIARIQRKYEQQTSDELFPKTPLSDGPGG